MLDETPLPKTLFDSASPIGCLIRVDIYRWFLIRSKHPEEEITINAVQSCLNDPDLIKKSNQDDRVCISYKKICLRGNFKYLLVVFKKINGMGFIITTYISDKIKTGETLWQK